MYNFRLPFMQPPFSNVNNFYKKNYYNKTKYEKNNSNIKNPVNSKSDFSKALPASQSTDQSVNQSTEILFEIFGVKIYFDDLLIICILLFLYQEGIQDEYLFISLILLLLS